MKIKRFEDMIAWQKAKELAVYIYCLMESNRDFGFKDQLQRASVSIMNNIAEGFERKGDKEFQRYLFIAKGSAGEVRSMSYLALELNYINQKEYEKIHDLSEELSKIIYGFIQALH